MRKVGVLVLLIAIAAMLATVGAGWKWGHGQSREAGWSWDDSTAAYVWAKA
jgi:hypothetical protein